MHIPENFLSPQTVGTLGIGMIPFWIAAAKKTAKSLKVKQVPLLALGAAFTFVIMMFNIPLPNGTTLHPVGGALIAIVLGPWAATIGITIALVIQALFFGDGGLIAIGANSFNLAVVMPFSAYYIYRLISGSSVLTSRRRWIGAAVAAFVSLNLAALLTAVELGIQPLLFHTADGRALYFPYTLAQAIPAVSLGHLLVGGPVEAIITAMVVRYFQSANLPMLALYPTGNGSTAELPAQGKLLLKKLWTAMIALVMLTPLGLLASGTAWGEWSGEEIKNMIGYVPKGIAREPVGPQVNFLNEYGISGWSNNFFQSATGYILSAIVALVIIFLLVYLFNKFQTKGEERHDPR